MQPLPLTERNDTLMPEPRELFPVSLGFGKPGDFRPVPVDGPIKYQESGDYDPEETSELDEIPEEIDLAGKG